MKNQRIVQKSVSFIIPLHNEEGIFVAQMNKLIKTINLLGLTSYEIILIENGSTDKTYRLAKKVRNKNITVIKSPNPHYGLAIKRGLLTSKYDLVIQLDLDLIDFDFIKKAIASYGKYDILIGSKFLGKVDNRSIFRKALSIGLKKVINILFNYYGTDTHGIKSYQKEKINDLILELPMTKHMFDTSIVIGAENLGLNVRETAVDVQEIRPSRFPSNKRIFEAILDVLILLKFKLNNYVKFRLLQSKNYINSLKFPIPFI